MDWVGWRPVRWAATHHALRQRLGPFEKLPLGALGDRPFVQNTSQMDQRVLGRSPSLDRPSHPGHIEPCPLLSQARSVGPSPLPCVADHGAFYCDDGNIEANLADTLPAPGLGWPVAHLPLDGPGVLAASAGAYRLIQELPEGGFMEGRPLPRGGETRNAPASFE